MIKTTDGKQATEGNHYFTCDGHEVRLETAIELPTGECKYMVEYFYEATGMDVKCYGGAPVEIEYPFEVYGGQTIINKLFHKAPDPREDASFVSAIKEMHDIGDKKLSAEKELRSVENSIERRSSELKSLISEIDSMSGAVSSLLSQESGLSASVSRLESKLNELMHSKSTMSKEDDELLRLKDRDRKLTLLEKGGVDNWEWYDESLKDYLTED